MERGTGKTTKLLKATPAGGVFIVHSTPMIGYIQQWLEHAGRGGDQIMVKSITQVESLQGLSRPITVDHTITERQCSFIEKRDEEMLAIMCYRQAPFYIKLDENGDVTTHWRDGK